jgi:hypothetical protein
MFAVNIPQSLLIGGNSGPIPTAFSIIYIGETENNNFTEEKQSSLCFLGRECTQMEIQGPSRRHP